MEIAPPQEIPAGSIASRVSTRGEILPAALIYRHPAGFMEIMDSSGRTSPTVGPGPESHDVLHGVEIVHSFGAALSWAMAEVLNMVPTSFPHVYKEVLSRNLSGIGEVRRAAIELARSGLAEILPHLALTPTERSWWTALAHLRTGDYQSSLNVLESLPEGRYSVRRILIRVLEEELGLLGSRRAVFDAEKIPVTTGAASLSDFGYLARLAKLDPLLIEQVSSNRLPTSPLSTGALVRPTTSQIIENARAKQAIEPTLRIPPRMSSSLIDDLIDAGVEMPIQVFESLSNESRLYFTARIDPGLLRDDEIEELELTAELQRRRAMNGNMSDLVNLPGVPEEVRLKALFLRDREVTMEMRELIPLWVSDLEKFMTSETEVRTIPSRLVEDGFLWDFLADLLGSDVIKMAATQDVSSQRFLGWACLRRAILHLHEKEADKAIDAAKSVLRHSDAETVRDEAMNIIACAHWLSGRDSEAVSALQNALQGQRNPSLQVNLGVVATTANPEVAALELARLVSEADSLELRSNAALRAAGIWLHDENNWGSDVQTGMPIQIRDALRLIVVEPIPIETFAVIAKVLSVQDREWFANLSNIRASLHASTIEARVLSARASGLDNYVKVMGAELSKAQPSSWLLKERDTFVDGAIRDAVSDPTSRAGLFLFEAVYEGLPVLDRQKVVLVPLGVLEMCSIARTDQGEPEDRFFELLLATQTQFQNSSEWDEVQELFEEAWGRLTMLHCACAHGVLVKLGEIHDNGVKQLSSVKAGGVNKDAVRGFFQPLSDDATSIERSLRRFTGRSSSAEVIQILSEVVRFASELRLLCQQNMS
jgi:hypothetical protein